MEREFQVQKSEDERVYSGTQKKDTQVEKENRRSYPRITKCEKKLEIPNEEIQRLTIELSETQKLNQSLQQSNDDLRNRNGLKSRSEQEQLEEEIRDVRNQNSKLQIQVNKSSVEAVDEAAEETERSRERWTSARRDWRMNLIEIGKKPETQPTETADQMKNLPDTTDKWKQLAKEQAASLELVTEERDELQVRNQKMNEFIQEFQERTHKLKMEKQKLFFENHEMQDEIRKLNDEIHRLTIELSETQKLNQSLQKNNDDLRNRNGLKSRSEQEQLEEEIKDVRNQNSKLQIQVNKSSVEAVDEAQKKQKEAEKDVRNQNSKLQIQVNKSSVEAVDEAQKKQKEAEKKMEQAEAKARNEKKSAELEIRKAKKEVKARTEKMRDIEYFWGMGYVTVILFAIVQNGAFQNDFIDFFRTPFMWYVRFCEWLVHPTYDNGFNQKIAYTGGEAWIIRILAIVAVLFILAIVMVTIVKVIKRYKKMWDEISQMFLLGSLSGIAVLGDVIREYLPVNLILTFGFINVGIMLLKMYFQKKFEEKSLYADNHYD